MAFHFKPDMEKTFFTQGRLEAKLFYPKKWVNCNKSEFATKQRKVHLTISMTKINLARIYRGNNYVINEMFLKKK